MNGKQQLVAFVGAALIFANLVTEPTTRDKMTAAIFTKGQSPDDVKAAHHQLMVLAGELGLVLVLVVASGAGEGIANIALVFTIGLALVWAMTRFGNAPLGVGGRVGRSRQQ